MASWKKLRLAVVLAIMFLTAISVAQNMDAFEEQHSLTNRIHARGDRLPMMAHHLIARESPETVTVFVTVTDCSSGAPTVLPPTSSAETTPVGIISSESSSCVATTIRKTTVPVPVASTATAKSLCSTKAISTGNFPPKEPSCSGSCTVESTVTVAPTQEPSLTPSVEPSESSILVTQPHEESTSLRTSSVQGTSERETSKNTAATSVSVVTSHHVNTESGASAASSIVTMKATPNTTSAHAPSATEAHTSRASRGGELSFQLFVISAFLVLLNYL